MSSPFTSANTVLDSLCLEAAEPWCIRASLYKGHFPKHLSSCLSSKHHSGALLEWHRKKHSQKSRQGTGQGMVLCLCLSWSQSTQAAAFGDGEFFHAKSLLLFTLELAQFPSSAGTPREGVWPLSPSHWPNFHLPVDSLSLGQIFLGQASCWSVLAWRTGVG